MSTKRFVIAAAVALAIGIAPVAETVPSALAARVSPPAGTRLEAFVCQRALDPPTRAVSITAVMPTLPGTEKLALRFELLRRAGQSRAFVEVNGHGLRTWEYPDNPTLGQRSGDVWILNHPVVNLIAPAVYRYRVTFRWIGARGRTLSELVRESQLCNEPELRPDLVVRSLTVQAIPGSPLKDAYIAQIANTGATAAGSFDVQFIDNGAVQERGVGVLAPHATIRERFVGAACTTGAATVTADPGHKVDVSARGKASLTAICPAT